MMSRGRFVTLTGLFAIATATAALAQPVVVPVPPVPAVLPAPVVAPAPAVPAALPEPAAAPIPVMPDMPPVPPVPAVPPVMAIPEIQHFDFDYAFDLAAPVQAITQQAFDPVEIARAVQNIDRDQIREAVDKAREFAEQARELRGPIKIDVDAMRWAMDVDGLTAAMKIEAKELKALTKLDGMKAFKLSPAEKAFRMDEKSFAKGQDYARMFERCDSQRGDADEQEDRFYDCGRRAIDESQWERAVDYFTRAAGVKGGRADGALYWKAYSQNRLGQRAEALTTLAELKSGYGKSRWTNDASALEVEVRQRAGQKVDPANTPDDELKLIVLNSLGDSPDAVPILERLLAGPQSPKLKERALFVLAQNQNPAARAVVIKIAKGGGNPELQLRAVQYVGRTRTQESREVLAQVYGTTAEANVKRMIIRTYMEAQDRERLLALARTETDQALRMEAVRQLGNMRAGAELSELYVRETSPEVKKQILRGMANGGSIDRLIAVAETEKDPELKRTAIRTIGVNRDTSQHLLNFYVKDTNPEVRKAVIDALFTQNNATALVTIARKETDIELRKNLVNRLGNMRDNPEAKQYLLELLK